MHDLTLISTLAGALTVALLFGWLTRKLGLSTLVGYMLAGIVVGPYTPGFVADANVASEMAEIGVILLMFSVGQHFHPQDLLRVYRVAVPGAVAQSALAGAAGWAVARALGWSHGAGAVFGMALAVASTVVLMRMLLEQDRVHTRDGHVAVGWLIVEDLFTVAALVVLPALATQQSAPSATAIELAAAIGKAAVFAGAVWVLGTRLVSPFIDRMARTRSTELFTLTVFVVALGIAVLAAEVFNVSVALGAFFAGLVVGQSRFGPQAAADMLPFRDVFSALFFVSVGMLFNPAFIFAEPVLVLAALGIVLVLKPLAAIAIVAILRDGMRTALTVGVGLAQIGEFSFILAALGRSTGVLPPAGFDALVAAAIVSIAINPLLFRAAAAFERRFAVEEEARKTGPVLPAPPDSGPAVVVAGYGELGRRLVQQCREAGFGVSVVDDDVDVIEELHGDGITAVYGDASKSEVLRAAGIAHARVVVITSELLADKMRGCIAARQVNPRIEILASAASRGERVWLHEFGAAAVSDVYDETAASLMRSIRNAL